MDLHKKRIVREIKKRTAHKFQVGDNVRVILPKNPVLPIAFQNNRKVKEKEEDKVDKLIGREIRKKFQHHGYFISKVNVMTEVLP